MAGHDATEGRSGGVSRRVAGIIVIGSFALGLLLGTVGNTNPSGSNLRDANKVQKHAFQTLETPPLDSEAGNASLPDPETMPKVGGAGDGDQLFEGVAWGSNDEEKADWKALFGADAPLTKGLHQLHDSDDGMSYSFLQGLHLLDGTYNEDMSYSFGYDY